MVDKANKTDECRKEEKCKVIPEDVDEDDAQKDEADCHSLNAQRM